MSETNSTNYHPTYADIHYPSASLTPLITDDASKDDRIQQIHDMVNDIHEWMGELMPVARAAVKMFNAKQKLTKWVPGARRED